MVICPPQNPTSSPNRTHYSRAARAAPLCIAMPARSSRHDAPPTLRISAVRHQCGAAPPHIARARMPPLALYTMLRRWGMIFPVKLLHSIFHSLAYTYTMYKLQVSPSIVYYLLTEPPTLSTAAGAQSLTHGLVRLGCKH